MLRRFSLLLVVLVGVCGAAAAQTPPTTTLIDYTPFLVQMLAQIKTYMEQLMPTFLALAALIWGPRLFIKMIDYFLK